MSVKNVEKDYRIHGTIRFRKTVKSKDKIINYGIQCVNDDRKVLLEIKKFAESKKKVRNIKKPNNSL
ncbi:MAG: hypothetical protein CMH78_00145 [Nitrospinae bacterium]|nr:hypothetical protein [Nitrospinota bacterium]MDP7581360.1 hypothetical protein [Nitrospinota bacterium]HJN01641.1 hypothetical protein [Nitrospinota bacterium]